MGKTPAEYERTVGPANQYFLEVGAMVKLSREGILPLDDDDRPDPSDGPTFDVTTHGRGG